jgi:hypothetical protein
MTGALNATGAGGTCAVTATGAGADTSAFRSDMTEGESPAEVIAAETGSCIDAATGTDAETGAAEDTA